MAMDEFNAGIQEAGLMPLPMQGEWYNGTTVARAPGVYESDWIGSLLMINDWQGFLCHPITALLRAHLTTYL